MYFSLLAESGWLAWIGRTNFGTNYYVGGIYSQKQEVNRYVENRCFVLVDISDQGSDFAKAMEINTPVIVATDCLFAAEK